MTMTPVRSDYVMVDDNNINGYVNHSFINQVTTDGIRTNGSTEAPENSSSPWSFEFSVTMATLLSISAFFTIVGNIMVLMVIIRHRGMRTRTNLFLVNLAVADLLVGLVVLPFPITTLIEGRWVFGRNSVCYLNGWMNAFCLVTSIHTLMYIGIHKFFSIVKPLNNPLKLQHIIGMMAAAWFWGACIATLTVLGLKVRYKPGTSQCGPTYPRELKEFLYHGIIQFTVILVPFFILVYCYVRMFREIKRHSERLRHNSTVEEVFLITQQKKVAITLFIVLTTFVMMVLPYHIYASYTSFNKDKKHFPSFINPVAYFFLYLSSMCNPIIYAFRSPAFREGYKEILCQTPNYVISDESDRRRFSRLSSIFALRRYSRRSMSNATSLLDSESTINSPLPTSPSQTTNVLPWPDPKKKKKSLGSLVRSTRQSNASSIIHRDGEVIIVKGGKIVSVRRASDSVSSSSRGPSKPLLDMARRVDNSSRTVMLGIALTAGNSDSEEDSQETGHRNGNGHGKASVGNHRGQNSSEAKSDIDLSFERMDSDIADLDREDSEIFENGDKSEDLQLKEFKTSETKETSVSEENLKSDQKPNQTGIPTIHENTFPSIEINSAHGDSQTSLEPTAMPPSSALSKMVLNIGFNADMLVGMPLSPQARNGLAKSDMNLSVPPKLDNPNSNDISGARSTENVNPYRPHLKRLPSFEHLDPPVRLIRSRSSIGIHRSSHSKSPSPFLKRRNQN